MGSCLEICFLKKGVNLNKNFKDVPSNSLTSILLRRETGRLDRYTYPEERPYYGLPKSQERSQKNPDSLILNKNNMITEKWVKKSFY